MAGRNENHSNETHSFSPPKNGDGRRRPASASKENAADIPRPADPSDLPAPNLILSDTGFRYHPLWELRRNDVFCYLCEAFWNTGSDRPVTEGELRAEFEDAGRAHVLDVETLHKATRHASEIAQQYGVLKVLIPVHFSTLADAQTAETYTQACGERVWEVIDSVYFEIIRAPASASKDLYVQATERIRPFGQEVMLRLEPGFDRFDQIPAEEFLSVGLSVRADPRPEPDILADLEAFSLDAATRGIRTYVHGIQSIALSAAAVRLGFYFIGSDSIAPPLETTELVGQFATPDDLLKSLLTAKRAE